MLTNEHSFVRERHESPEDPNRPVMTVADSPKKRKRTLSPLPSRKLPLHTEEAKVLNTTIEDMAPEKESQTEAEILAAFVNAMGNEEAIETYNRDHAKLLKDEEENAWDRHAKPKITLESDDDKIEERAATIIGAIREFERNVVFGNLPSETVPGPETLDMGGQFLTNKDRIDNQSKLYEIAKMVPKGALLHLHFNAELHPEHLLEQARDMPNMYIRSLRSLESEADLGLTEVVFNVLDASAVEPNVNIFSNSYLGYTFHPKNKDNRAVWMRWSKFQKEFEKKAFSKDYRQQEPSIIQEVPHSCAEPGKMSLSPAENWLKSKMVLSLDEAYGPTQTVNG
jgi:adenosine deaminase CECR1